MKKIQSLFKRDYTGDRLVYNEVVEGSEWVILGEGVATRKFDGTACAIIGGKLYKRYDVKKGRQAPKDAIPCQEPDEITGHWPHWVACDESKPEDKYFFEAFVGSFQDGTYELIGEKINGNPERITGHRIVLHGSETIESPRTFDELKEWLKDKDIEGLVWHHPDGRMVKIKKKDFGYNRAE